MISMIKTYYRRITESLPHPLKKGAKSARKQLMTGLGKENLRYHLMHFSTMFMAILFIFLLYYIAVSYIRFIETRDEHERIVGNLQYWEKVIKKHPNFPDGYYNAALYAAMINQKERSIALLDRALTLDPEFKEAMELEKTLDTRE